MASMYPPLPPPSTSLGKYRAFARHASVHLSPIALGTASIGDQWSQFGWGAADKESSFKVLDTYYEAGGNFIDTANNYQDESSEEFIGEWAEKRGIRQELFLASKYTSNYKMRDKQLGQSVMFTGNNLKSLLLSVEGSLKKLRTTYLDLLYLHFWDYDASVEEVMNGLHNLVTSGKVLYLGVSNTPAWWVSKANQYARDHGKTPFVVYQGAWNVMERSLEREIIPMAKHEGMAIVPYHCLSMGRIRSDEEEERRRENGEGGRFGGSWERTEQERKMCNVLAKIGKEVGTNHVTAVAIAYLMNKAPYVFPVIGGRKAGHLLENIEAIDIALSAQQLTEIESVFEFRLGYPYEYFGTGEDYPPFMAAHISRLPSQRPVRPSFN